MLKSKLREKILKIRKKKNKNNIQINFKKVFDIIKKERLNYKNLGGYFPVNFEVDDLEILKNFERKGFKISLPVIKKNFQMDFYQWSFTEILKINKYGIPEPEAKNLIGIYSSLTNTSLEKNVNNFSGKNFSEFKENLSQIIVDQITPISIEIKKLLNEKNYLDQILLDGYEKANEIASKKLKKIHEIVGF